MRLPLFSTILLGAVVSAATKSPDGSCGGSNGYVCQGTSFGNCCSVNGWCGSSDAYCGNDCQASFGTCSGVAPDPSFVSPDGTCGGANSYTCIRSAFGGCCSVNGWCGSTDAYCAVDSGCQGDYGYCVASSPPTTPLQFSSDGTCGNGFSCAGSNFGNCCSAAGYCGSTADYCNAGCQPAFGDCGLPKTSTDGKCGPGYGAGATCEGYPGGGCCSPAGLCGDEAEDCGLDCQTGFGKCFSLDGTCSFEYNCAGSGFGNCCSPGGYWFVLPQAAMDM